MRATGRTFRAILKAALALSGGEDTVVVCINYTEAARFIKEVSKILHLQGITSHPLASVDKYSIRFMDTHLTAVTVHDRNSPAFKGRRYTNIIEDY